jgi:hypothetical protein
VSDGNGGCTPILPANDCGEGELAVPGDTACYAVGAAGDAPTCPSGQLAVPGESACHALADCGSGPWGNVPVDATTQYVDSSYAGGGSDGSAGRPWTTIGDAVSAAAPGAVVAVADGTYHEDVLVKYAAVKLWGRCPDRVEVVGTSPALTIASGAVGSEVHQIALTGASVGASLGAAGIVLDRMWVHDTGGDGLEVFGGIALRNSLIERATHVGVRVRDGASATLDADLVRDTAPATDGSGGRGVEAASSSTPGTVAITHSLFERNHDLQIALFGSDGLVDGCLVRDGLPAQDGTNGMGIWAQFEQRRPKLTLRSSTLERNTNVGLWVQGADALVESTLIRDMRPQATDGTQGLGVYATLDASGGFAHVTATSVLVERARFMGIRVDGSSLDLLSSSIRDTQSDQDGQPGGAVSVTDLPRASTLHVARSVLERNRGENLFVGASAATVEGSVLRDATLADGIAWGIQLSQGESGSTGNLTLTGSVVAASEGVGVYVTAGDLVVERTVVSSTQASGGLPGVGVYVGPDSSLPAAPRPTVSLDRSRIDGSVGTGFYLFDADATLSQVRVRGTAALPDGSYGDGVSIDGDATVAAAHLRIEGSARAGLSMFATAAVSLGSASLACNAISIDGEDQSTFTAQGPLACPCDDAAASCQVLSSGLRPPPPIHAPPAP